MSGDELPEAQTGSETWLVFGDLMAGMLGLFALFVVWLVLFQVDLAGDLAAERSARVAAASRLETVESERAAEEARRAAIEASQAKRQAALRRALALPLANGRITIEDGRIGIAGSVLFDLYSADLRPEGRAVLTELAGPLSAWLKQEDEMVMVGGFTDDLPIHGESPDFADNWELSTERALTVVRELRKVGVPPGRMFAAGFGEHHPAVPNVDEQSRARNRRVEIVPQRREAR